MFGQRKVDILVILICLADVLELQCYYFFNTIIYINLLVLVKLVVFLTYITSMSIVDKI